MLHQNYRIYKEVDLNSCSKEELIAIIVNRQKIDRKKDEIQTLKDLDKMRMNATWTPTTAENIERIQKKQSELEDLIYNS